MIRSCRAEDRRGIYDLWRLVFEDEEGYICLFFDRAYGQDRCLTAVEGSRVVGMVHWLSCSCEGKQLGYLYALAVHPAFRNRGLGRRLVQEAVEAMRKAGYCGVVLLPGEDSLRGYYEKLGFESLGELPEQHLLAGDCPVSLEEICPAAYFSCRRAMLPKGGVVQEGAFVRLLAWDTRFYRGEGLLLAAREEPTGSLLGLELLGDPALAPGLLAALGYPRGVFRRGAPRAMYRPLTEEAPAVAYFAFALD